MFFTIIFGLCAALASAQYTNVQQVCQSLKASHNASTTLPSDGRYNGLSTENWSATAWGHPNCIVQPLSTSDVEQFVSLFSKQRVPFAIRSGGHMPSPLAANTKDGVLIDLSSLNATSYDASKNTVIVGAGARWGDLYHYLDPYEVTVVGGRVLDVGVGGLILGCGLSYLSDLYGLACDNVANFEVVLANGSAVNANESSHQSLFRALKGGSNNFGVVTAFTLYTYPIHKVWGGVKLYASEQLPALFNALAEYQSNPNKDLYANLMLQPFATNHTDMGAMLNMVYLKPEVSPPAFQPFYGIPTLDDRTKLQTITEMINGQIVPAIPRWDWFTTSFVPSAVTYSQIWSIISSAPEVKAIESLTAGTLILGLQPITSNLVQAGHARGQNSLGLKNVNQTWFVFDVGWWNAEDDAIAHHATQSIHNAVENRNKGNGTFLPYKFMNDASWDQAVIEGYGAANVDSLRKVQSVYDPDAVFSDLVPGGFKVPRRRQY